MLLIPFGIFAALVGMCAAALYPKIDALQGFPTLIAHMDNLLATVVVAGLAGSLFGPISAISIGTATLLYKDFYLPFDRAARASFTTPQLDATHLAADRTIKPVKSRAY